MAPDATRPLRSLLSSRLLPRLRLRRARAHAHPRPPPAPTRFSNCRPPSSPQPVTSRRAQARCHGAAPALRPQVPPREPPQDCARLILGSPRPLSPTVQSGRARGAKPGDARTTAFRPELHPGWPPEVSVAPSNNGRRNLEPSPLGRQDGRQFLRFFFARGPQPFFLSCCPRGVTSWAYSAVHVGARLCDQAKR